MSQRRIHTGKVALISGGLGDIGFAIASVLADQGASIALCDLLSDGAAKTKLDALRSRTSQVDYRTVDVANAADVGEWVRGVSARMGSPTLVVPNAAIVAYCSTLSTTPMDFEHHLKVNLLGSFFMAQEAARILIAQKAPGRIIFIGSWVAHAPSPQILPYTAAKAALRMVMQCMALELAPRAILVNEVAPGFVDAGLSAQEFKQVPGSREVCQRQVPTGKLLTAEDVAKKVALLCHPDADEITGISFTVDSGLSLVTPGYLPSPADSGRGI
jgi:glucose 1-dehydrogenase